ncbi:polysaccharide biosynthesis/export family protein [Bryocella elongata]|nr:polysaccharide biosynthesis/export family protein [Bryocella elongata]
MPSFAQQGMAHPAITPRPTTTAPVTPQATAAQVGSSPQDSATYVIGADDQLQITVWKETALTGPLTVRPDGQISMPLLGDVPAAGKTPMQLADLITAGLKKYVNDPTVTVTVSQVNSKRVFLIGQVGHIGPIMITPGMTVLQAISTAGGLTPYANGKKIYILRGPQGAQKKIPFNYKTAVRDGNQQGVALEPGDTIVVP